VFYDFSGLTTPCYLFQIPLSLLSSSALLISSAIFRSVRSLQRSAKIHRTRMPECENEPHLYTPRMPEVDFPPDLKGIFNQARRGGELAPLRGPSKYVAVVTPGRMVMTHPCPAPGTMNPSAEASVEKILPSTNKRKVAVIAFTQLEALRADLKNAIPFFGLLTGMAYINHTVWVLECHSSALAPGCREADLLIVDELMIPFLAPDWLRTVSKVMAHPLVYKHERASFSLKILRSVDSTLGIFKSKDS
jgi:hypothetical protein